MSWKLALEATQNPGMRIRHNDWSSTKFVEFNEGDQCWRDDHNIITLPKFGIHGWEKFEAPKEKVKYTKFFFKTSFPDYIFESSWVIDPFKWRQNNSNVEVVDTEEREF